jgi:hypothetical protein
LPLSKTSTKKYLGAKFSAFPNSTPFLRSLMLRDAEV